MKKYLNIFVVALSIFLVLNCYFFVGCTSGQSVIEGAWVNDFGHGFYFGDKEFVLIENGENVSSAAEKYTVVEYNKKEMYVIISYNAFYETAQTAVFDLEEKRLKMMGETFYFDESIRLHI